MTQTVPLRKNPIDAWVRVIAGVVNNILQGHLNNTLTVTLATGAASTSVTDARIGVTTTALAQPVTADAAAALATTYWVCANGGMTIYHANNMQADRTFNFAFLG